MNNIPKVSLEDTYHLIQLAREAALAQGRKAQAEQLKPVMEEMRSLVDIEKASQAVASDAVAPEATASDAAASDAALSRQPGFQKLLELSRMQTPPETNRVAANPGDRNRLIQAMAAADVSTLDIARQLGMTRDEVNLVVETGRKAGVNRR